MCTYFKGTLMLMVLLLPYSITMAQLPIQNGSFEGEPGYGYPNGWTRCLWDEPSGGTLPYEEWNIPAHEGLTYLCMNNHEHSPVPFADSVVTKLSCPLVSGRLHRFKISLICLYEGVNIGASGHTYLNIYGGDDMCTTSELLWQSTVIPNEWATFYGSYIANGSWEYLILKASSTNHNDVGIGIDAMSDIYVEGFTFAKLDTSSTVADNCYEIKTISDYINPMYSWHSTPPLQFSNDSVQSVCITSDTWVYLDIVACSTYRDSVFLKYNNPTGLEHACETNKFSVYPNPSNGLVNICIDEGRGTLYIHNQLGQQVYSTKLSKPCQVIDMQPYGAGMYFYELKDGIKSYKGKFVVD